jgi:hypothetical protein
MKNLIYIFILILGLSSCTDIIDIELNSAMQRVVVEAKITDQSTPATLYLSRTTDYFNPNDPVLVSGAKVSLNTASGQSVNMVEIDEGVYQSTELEGASGETYTLKIEDGDELYEASSKLPTKVKIDSLVFEWFNSFSPHDSLGGGYMLNLWYTDPVQESNFYMFTFEKLNKSDIPEPGFPGSNAKILMNDALSNGKSSLMNLNRRGFYEIGDTVFVELISIDQNTYNYLDQLGEVSGGGPSFGSSAPANPQNNISNGAMGYFSAQAIDSKVVVIK